MGKLIIFIIIIAIIYFLFFKKTQVNNTKSNEESEDLIMCDKCKTFTTKNEIIKINGKNICKDCYDNS